MAVVTKTDAELLQELISLGFNVPDGVDGNSLFLIKLVEQMKKEKGITLIADLGETAKPSHSHPHQQEVKKEEESESEKKTKTASSSKSEAAKEKVNVAVGVKRSFISKFRKMGEVKVKNSTGAPKTSGCPPVALKKDKIPFLKIMIFSLAFPLAFDAFRYVFRTHPRMLAFVGAGREKSS